MKEPRIQYAKTSDGVKIAFWTLGGGPPLVFMLPMSHVQLEWQIPEWRSWAERLATNQQLVRYDGRGTGMSDRNVTDFSLEAHVLDLEAVADRLRLDTFALLGQLSWWPAAVAYAARHQERISSLVLWCPMSSPVDAARSPTVGAVGALLEHGDWELYTETLGARRDWLGGRCARAQVGGAPSCQPNGGGGKGKHGRHRRV